MFWKRTWLVMWKEFIELFRDKGLLPAVFIMPVIQLVLFGYVVSADVRNLSTAIVDQDHTVASQRVGDALLNSGYFVLAGQAGRRGGRAQAHGLEQRPGRRRHPPGVLAGPGRRARRRRSR